MYIRSFQYFLFTQSHRVCIMQMHNIQTPSKRDSCRFLELSLSPFFGQSLLKMPDASAPLNSFLYHPNSASLSCFAQNLPSCTQVQKKPLSRKSGQFQSSPFIHFSSFRNQRLYFSVVQCIKTISVFLIVYYREISPIQIILSQLKITN